MTDRAIGVVAAAAGMVLVTLLMLRGVDLARAAATGPRWRRRLVAAGIAVLTACGARAETYEPPEVHPTCYMPAAIEMEEGQRSVVSLQAQFKLLNAQLAAGTVTTDTAQVAMQALENELQRLADPAVFATIPEDEWNDARRTIGEAQALLKEVRARREELAAVRPLPPAPTCYVMPMPFSIGQDAVMRLSLQTVLLRQQLAAGTIATDTAHVIIRTIEGDVRVLSDTGVLGSIPPEEQDEARRKMLEAQALLAEVKAMTDPRAQLANRSEWREYLAVRDEAETIVAHARGSYPFDQAGKTKLLGDLRAAAGQLDTLAVAGLVTAAEAELLKKDLQELIDGVTSFRPSEMQRATCYLPMPVRNPAERGMTRVNDRIILLRQLVEQATINADVLRPVLDDLRADLAALNAADNLQRLPAAQRAGAEKAGKAAAQALAEIERLLAGRE